MTRISALMGALVLWCAAATGAMAQTPAAQTPVERHGQLRVEGTRILDQHGQPVMLRGMSLFWSQWMPQYYNADVVRWLVQDWNVNVIRAAVAVEPDGYLEDPEREYAKAVAVIDAAIANGIYVIVDWHAHERRLRQASEFFDRIAERYGDHPNIIYETWNEPLPRHDWRRHIKPYHEELVSVIRMHDPDNLIILGSSSWAQDVDEAAAEPVAGTNLAYTLHFYAGTHREELRDKARAAMQRGVALFVTEYGSTEASGDGPIDRASTQAWWDFMEENKISYLSWSIADKVETSAALRPGASGQGGWTDDMITENGLYMRERYRTMNAQ